jgi:hypothetical protein
MGDDKAIGYFSLFECVEAPTDGGLAESLHLRGLQKLRNRNVDQSPGRLRVPSFRTAKVALVHLRYVEHLEGSAEETKAQYL